MTSACLIAFETAKSCFCLCVWICPPPSLIPQTLNEGLVTHNRILRFQPQKNAITNQIGDNKNTSPVITNFVQIDSTTPEMEMNLNVY